MRAHSLIVLYILAGGLGQLLLRVGARSSGAKLAASATTPSSWVPIVTSPWVLGGLFFWVASTLVWLTVLSRTELTYAYGLGAASYLFVPIAARLVLGESLPPVRLLGMILVAAGIACVLVTREIPRAP